MERIAHDAETAMRLAWDMIISSQWSHNVCTACIRSRSSQRVCASNNIFSFRFPMKIRSNTSQKSVRGTDACRPDCFCIPHDHVLEDRLWPFENRTWITMNWIRRFTVQSPDLDSVGFSGAIRNVRARKVMSRLFRIQIVFVSWWQIPIVCSERFIVAETWYDRTVA
jgi:hypothetical protein